jgi:hypothetical protein
MLLTIYFTNFIILWYVISGSVTYCTCFTFMSGLPIEQHILDTNAEKQLA